MRLNDTDRKYLDEVYARAYKKYFAFSSSGIFTDALTFNDAFEAAREELEAYNTARRKEINTKFNERIAEINTEAGKRGLLTSTIIMQQIEKAEYDRTITLQKFESVTDSQIRALARKMMNDNAALLKLQQKADKDSLDIFTKQSTVGGFSTTEKQKAMDEEVYGEYLRFLVAQSPEVALSYIEDDPVFYFNLSTEYYQKLLAEAEKRGWRT